MLLSSLVIEVQFLPDNSTEKGNIERKRLWLHTQSEGITYVRRTSEAKRSIWDQAVVDF